LLTLFVLSAEEFFCLIPQDSHSVQWMGLKPPSHKAANSKTPHPHKSKPKPTLLTANKTTLYVQIWLVLEPRALDWLPPIDGRWMMVWELRNTFECLRPHWFPFDQTGESQSEQKTWSLKGKSQSIWCQEMALLLGIRVRIVVGRQIQKSI